MGYFTERRFERKFKPRNGEPVRKAKYKPKCNMVSLENPKRNKQKQLRRNEECLT